METERARLLHFKQLEEGEAFDGKLNPWDLRYYMNVVEKVCACACGSVHKQTYAYPVVCVCAYMCCMVCTCVQEDYKVDHAEIQKYFPLDVVTKGMLSMYETLLGLTFVLEEGAQTWHEDVLLYNVEDAKSGSHMGQFYLDLYPRPGKFGHAAVFPLVGRAVDAETNAVQTPVVAMVANFPKPTDSQTSLLPHNEVRTYFHELGHVMHGVCTQVSLRRFSGTNVERDFVEAPSQMLENWVFEPEALARMSGHVDDNSKPLPAELVDALVASKNANVALSSKRQLVFGLLDQTIHSTPDADTAQIYRDSLKEIMGMDAAPNTNMVASFGHLAGGYDSQYYGYMWSEVFSVDMFESRFKGHVLDPAVGADYRAAILAPGGSVDATKMLKNFLGRAPNSEAFLISKGLSK
jgi:thimet oligopeptidase